MKQGLTELVCILDKSGSMYRFTSDTVDGYNAMVEEQKKEPGEAVLTTVLFDDTYNVIRDHVDIQEAPPLTMDEYKAHGTTALLDAVGRTIAAVGERLAETPEGERPEHVVFAITTDGQENSSYAYTRERVREMVKHQQEKYNWKFIFIGAGIDAYEEAAVNFGITSPEYVMKASATTDGMEDIYRSMSKAMSCVRASVALDESWKVGETNNDRGYEVQV